MRHLRYLSWLGNPRLLEWGNDNPTAHTCETTSFRAQDASSGAHVIIFLLASVVLLAGVLVAFVNGRVKLASGALVLGALTFFFVPSFLKVAGLSLLALIVVVANKLDSTL